MNLFWQLVISLVVAVVSAVVTVRLAFRQFLAERWWERKADAYASILEALHIMKRGLDDVMNQITDQNRKTDQEYEKEQLRKYRAARDEVHKAVDTGSFLLASRATSLLQQLEKDLARAEKDNLHEGRFFDSLGALSDEIHALETCLKGLPSIARRDLRIPVEPLECSSTPSNGPETQTTPGNH